MIERFLEFIAKNKLIQESDKLLVAVSGGVDSMVLLHFCVLAEYDIVVGHINHNKRAEQSRADAIFVEDFCNSKNIIFEGTIIPNAYWKKSNNFQNAAREFRYYWLDEIAKKYDCNKVVTAHHKTDNLESFLSHSMRGTSIHGLGGIQIVTERLIRPLLFATKEEIEYYASIHKIPFRKDPTNDENNYNRNIIRNKVLPELLKVHPNNFNGFHSTLENLRENKILFNSLLESVFKKFVFQKKHWTEVQLKTLTTITDYKLVFFQFLKQYGFDKASSLNALSINEGQNLFSKNFQLTKHKDQLFIRKKRELVNFNQEFSETDYLNCFPFGEFYISEKVPELSKESNVEFIDPSLWKGKKRIRTIEKSDRFQPLGMNGQTKNVLKFLRDKDINPFEREQILVLEIEGEICWVIGHRLDERFKVKSFDENGSMLKWTKYD